MPIPTEVSLPAVFIIRDADSIVPSPQGVPTGGIIQANVSRTKDEKLDIAVSTIVYDAAEVLLLITSHNTLTMSPPVVPAGNAIVTLQAETAYSPTLTLSVVDGATRATLDRVSLRVAAETCVGIAPIGQTPAEIPFAAGNPDRFIETRSIVLVNESWTYWGGKIFGALPIGDRSISFKDLKKT